MTELHLDEVSGPGIAYTTNLYAIILLSDLGF